MADSSGKQVPNVNIDIKGEADTDGVKNMDLDSSSRSRAGLSKEELMKFANQPFWVRFRNILFASFWIVWVSILLAAVTYVIQSPGCTRLVSAANVTASTQSSSQT